MKVRLPRAIPLLCLAALASCAYFDLLNPPDPDPADKSITWQTRLGNGVKNMAGSVLETSDGSLMFVGTINLSWVNGNDLWLVKTDTPAATQWSIAWSVTFGGAAEDTGNCLRAASDGGYILLGSTRSMGAGSSDVYLVKTDADGNKLWEKTFGGSADDYGYSIQCIDGEYIIAGGTSSYGAGNSDLYLIKVDAGGNRLWEKTIGGPGFEEGYAVRQAPGGGFIIAGCTQASFDGDDNAWLVKTDASGIREWDRVFGTIAASLQDIPGCLEQAKDVLSTADGGYILAGYLHPSAVGDSDAWLIKTDSTGELEWSRTFGGGAMDQAEALVLTADGGYALAGMSRSYGPWNQAWLVKTDTAGNQEWEKHFGGSDEEWAFGLLQTANEGYILVGTASGNAGQAYLVYCKPWIESP